MVGAFDNFAPQLAQNLIRPFVPTKKNWVRRVADNYDPTGGSDPVVETTGSFRTGVPAPFKTKPVDGTSVLTDDLAIFVADLDIQQSGFDPFPADDATVIVVIDNVEYKVISFVTYKSGDLTAGYEFQIRK